MPIGISTILSDQSISKQTAQKVADVLNQINSAEDNLLRLARELESYIQQNQSFFDNIPTLEEKDKIKQTIAKAREMAAPAAGWSLIFP